MSANARRALKSLETLARARDMELADLKRVVNAALDRLKRTTDAIHFLDAAVLSETPDIGADFEMQIAFTRYAAGAKGRKRALASSIPALEEDISTAEAAVLEAFRGLKQIEEAIKSRREEIHAEEERKERVEADDMATMRAIRRNAH